MTPDALHTSNGYIDTLILLRKMQRAFMANLKGFMDKSNIKDLSASQAMMLFFIGQRSMKVSDILDIYFYEGANPSYNIKKMVQLDYLQVRSSARDRRVIFVSASEKGVGLYHRLCRLFQHQKMFLGCHGFPEDRWQQWQREIRQLQVFWTTDYSYNWHVSASSHSLHP